MASSRTARTIASTADPALIPLGSHEGKPPFLLTRPVFVIGSRSNARINLVSSTVSKAHALLVRSNGGVYIRDLASRNKVIINGKIQREADLRTGDTLQIGRFTFRYRGAPDVPHKVVEAPTARLQVAGQELPVPIDQRVLLIGRRIVCDVHLLEETVSTAHAVIFEVDGQRFIRDLGSRTGTFVNNVSTHQHQLTPGDKIRIGETELTYELGIAMGAADEPAVAEIEAEPLDLLGDLSPLETSDEAPIETINDAIAEPIAPVAELSREPATLAEALPLELEPLPLASTPIEPEVLDLPLAIEEVAPITETPKAAKTEIADVASIESSKASAQQDVTAEPIELLEPIAELPPAELSEISVGESLEPAIEAPVIEIETEVPLNLAPPQEELLPPIEDVEFAEAPIQAEVEPIVAPPVAEKSIEPQVAEPVVSSPIAEALMEPDVVEPIVTSIAEAPSEPEVVEPPLPPRDEVIAAIVAETPTPKKGRGKKKSIEVEPVPQVDGEESKTASKASKGKKPPVLKKQRGKPTLQPTDEEAPIEPAGDAEIIEPQPIESRPQVLPAGITPLGVVEPELVEPELLIPRETTELELSEPSARGPLIEPVVVETSTRTPTSPDPVLAAELNALPAEPLARGDASPIAEQSEPAAPAVVGHLSAGTLEPVDLAESSVESDTVAVEPLKVSEVASLNLPNDLSAIVTDELSAEDAKSIEHGDAKPMDLDAELEALLSDKDETTPDSDAVKASSDNDLALEALLGETEERPAADIDSIIDSPASSQTEAPDAEVNQALAVTATDLAPDPLAEQTPDTLTQKSEALTAEPDLSLTQAKTLADKMKAAGESDTSSKTAEPDIAQSQASKLLERVRWTANHDNVLGGQPLHLPESKASALSETPLVDETAHGEITSPDSVGQSTDAFLHDYGTNGHALSDERPVNQPRSLTSFEGLVNSPLREMDVFSQMSPPAEEELIDAEVINADNADTNGRDVGQALLRPRGTISGAFGEPVELPAHRQRVRPELNGSIADRVHPVRGEVTEAEARRIRKKYLRRVSTLVGLMVLLIGGSAIAIYNLIGVSSSVDAPLRFKNLGSLKQYDKNNFIADQLSKLKQDSTRKLARRMLNERNPEIASGFLDDQIEYVKTADASGASASDPEVLLVRLTGHDPGGDAPRAMAMVNALYMLDGTLLDDTRKRQSAVDELNRSINDTQNQLQSITEAIAKLRLTGESGPSLERRQELDAQLTKAEANWKAAVTAVTTSEAILTQMKAAAPGTPIDTQTTAPSIANDQQLAQLQQQLTESQAKIKANREAATKAATDARQNLDQTLAGFQKQVTDAQGMAGSNPELAAYIASAQRLQETLKQLTDDLIHRQEQQLGKLIEAKDQANEKMEVRRQEMLQSDNQLKDLNEQQAILTRQLNTALGTGLQKEADDLKARLELTKSMIKARQDLLPGDAFYADTIQRLQNLIDATRKNIADDRSKTEQQLTSLQASFTSSQVVERLPEEQKALATSLSQRLNDINAARKQYGQTLDAGASDSDDALKSQTTTIQASIEARQKQLADANLEAMRASQERDRVATIEAKQTELNKLKADELGLQKAYFAKQREVRDAQANADAAKDNSDKLDNLIRQQGALQADLKSKTDQISLRQSQASGVIEPQKPSESDLVIRRGDDKRLLYTLCSGGAILLLFSGLILWTLHTAHLVTPHTGLQATDLQPVAAEAPAELPAMPAEPIAESPAEPEPAGV